MSLCIQQVSDARAETKAVKETSDEKDKLAASLLTEKHTWQAIFMAKNDVNLEQFTSFMGAVQKKETK